MNRAVFGVVFKTKFWRCSTFFHRQKSRRIYESIKTREAKISRVLAGEYVTNDEKKLVEPVNFNSQKQMVDLLYIFIVEEDKSDFKFRDRLTLVKNETSQMENVAVVPSGKSSSNP